ncbi:hypothetical protein L1987_35932 [Smallanthus sonchifolius]|uniref:Uncharacterized protein n=1 Tax=Smallanthus sonchifolius TaxID=185202 RepID=A0ACB9HDG2_9ASTR|nr:hypothetical protein L1987_35932 [Smallanthus sonchifolius]
MEKSVYMWGYLPGALPHRSPIHSPVEVKLPQSTDGGRFWMDVCGGGCGFALAISVAGVVYTWGWKECFPSGTTVVGHPNTDRDALEWQNLFLTEQGNIIWTLNSDCWNHNFKCITVSPHSEESRSTGVARENTKRRRVLSTKLAAESSSSGDEPLSALPCLVAFNTGVRMVTVAAGGRHTLALSVAGTYIKGIACGGRHSAVITDAGALVTFGWGLYGQCGQGSTDEELRPTCVSSLLGIRVDDVAAGLWHTICISGDGDVYAFGGNQFGQLGTDGKVFCWGWNKYGQLTFHLKLHWMAMYHKLLRAAGGTHLFLLNHLSEDQKCFAEKGTSIYINVPADHAAHNIQLNTSLLFTVSHINCTNLSAELKWASPLEPPCKTDACCDSTSFCRAASNGALRCFCKPRFHWDAIVGQCASDLTRMRPKRSIFVATTMCSGVILLLSVVYAATIIIRSQRIKAKKKQLDREREEMVASGDSGKSAKIFTTKEIKKATKNFSSSGLLGVGGFGEVYKGVLDCGTAVAVKCAKLGNTKSVDQVLIEAVDFGRPTDDVNLVAYVKRMVNEERLVDVIDPTLKEHASSLDIDSMKAFGFLAMSCLEERRENRPSMKEVSEDIEYIM